MFSGRVVSGEEAARIGLANRAVPEEELMPAAMEMAKSFLENSWHTLRMDKTLINGGLDRTLSEGLAWEREVSPGSGPDTAERIKNFGKK